MAKSAASVQFFIVSVIAHSEWYRHTSGQSALFDEPEQLCMLFLLFLVVLPLLGCLNELQRIVLRDHVDPAGWRAHERAATVSRMLHHPHCVINSHPGD